MTTFSTLALASFLAFAPPGQEEKVKIDEKTKKAIDNALVFLKNSQHKDGSWGRAAITAYAIMAFMSNGHTPNQGLYGPEVSRGVRHLLAGARDDGYLVGTRGGNMYDHGMAALALTQVFGMTKEEEVKKTLKKSIDLIVKTQNSEGGWRYEPTPSAADISVTIMQVMALRGAKDSGLHVPDETMKKAIAYIGRCYDSRYGAYKYQPYSSGPGYARTAAGVCVLQLCGEYEAKEIARAVEWMEKSADDAQHFWYGHYYAAHAFHQLGGKKWEAYYSRLTKWLLITQKNGGEWSERMEGHVGPVYQTSIAVLILSVPANYLPIYQR
jgi:squalene cyclase